MRQFSIEVPSPTLSLSLTIHLLSYTITFIFIILIFLSYFPFLLYSLFFSRLSFWLTCLFFHLPLPPHLPTWQLLLLETLWRLEKYLRLTYFTYRNSFSRVYFLTLPFCWRGDGDDDDDERIETNMNLMMMITYRLSPSCIRLRSATELEQREKKLFDV